MNVFDPSKLAWKGVCREGEYRRVSNCLPIVLFRCKNKSAAPLIVVFRSGQEKKVSVPFGTKIDGPLMVSPDTQFLMVRQHTRHYVTNGIANSSLCHQMMASRE